MRVAVLAKCIQKCFKGVSLKTLILSYPGCIMFEVMLASELLSKSLPVEIATPIHAWIRRPSQRFFGAILVERQVCGKPYCYCQTRSTRRVCCDRRTIGRCTEEHRRMRLFSKLLPGTAHRKTYVAQPNNHLLLFPCPGA